MPTRPWTTTAAIDHAAGYFAIGTRFTVDRRRGFPGVVAATTGLWSASCDSIGCAPRPLGS